MNLVTAALRRVPYPVWNLVVVALFILGAGQELTQYSGRYGTTVGWVILAGFAVWAWLFHTRRPSWLLPWAYAISVAAVVAPPLLDGHWSSLLTGALTAGILALVLSSAWVDRLFGAPPAPNDGAREEPEGQAPA